MIKFISNIVCVKLNVCHRPFNKCPLQGGISSLLFLSCCHVSFTKVLFGLLVWVFPLLAYFKTV